MTSKTRNARGLSPEEKIVASSDLLLINEPLHLVICYFSIPSALWTLTYPSLN